MKKIFVSDVTLKAISKSLLFREKTAIASLADSLGADTVELAPIGKVREDTIIYKTIASNVSRAVLAIPVDSEEMLEVSFDAIKDAKHPRIQIELPVSTVQMEYTYHLKSDKMKDKISALVKRARELASDVEFSAIDATRADRGFLIEAVKAAEENGATLVSVSDTAGTALPEEIAELTKAVKAAVRVPVCIRPSDSLGMAAASAVQAILAGADGVKAAMSGGDTLSMKEISDVLSLRGDAISAECSLDSTRIKKSIDEMIKTINHTPAEVSEPDGKKKLLLDDDSTLTDVRDASALLGYELSDEDIGNVHRALIQVTAKKGAIGKKEFEAIIAGYAMQAPSTYHLENYTSSSSSVTTSMTQITLKRGDEILSGVSIGDGPIDSAFRAIEQCIGYHYELDDFQVQAITEGKEALGSAIVKLREGGRLYSGNGISTDIIAASIRAYLNALNKIVFEEK